MFHRLLTGSGAVRAQPSRKPFPPSPRGRLRPHSGLPRSRRSGAHGPGVPAAAPLVREGVPVGEARHRGMGRNRQERDQGEGEGRGARYNDIYIKKKKKLNLAIDLLLFKTPVGTCVSFFFTETRGCLRFS